MRCLAGGFIVTSGMIFSRLTSYSSEGAWCQCKQDDWSPLSPLPPPATFYPPTSSENKLRTIGGIFLLQRVMLEISVWFEDVTRMLMFVFLIRQFPDDTTLCLKWEIGCLIRFIYKLW